MFKGYLKGVTEELHKPSRGLGDTITKVTTIIGVRQAVDYFSHRMKKDCGCSGRTQKLNEMFPYLESVERYIAFYVTFQAEGLVFHLLDVAQSEAKLNLAEVKESPIYVLRWRNEMFVIAERTDRGMVDITHEDTLHMVRAMMLSPTSFRFFNMMSNGRFGMSDEDVANLQTNMNLFLKNNA